MEDYPHDWEELDTVMTNFDHSIDWDVAEKLKTGQYTAAYAGWNFNGRVWWAGTYKCAVWRYGSHVETVISDSLQEIMDTVSERYGYD